MRFMLNAPGNLNICCITIRVRFVGGLWKGWTIWWSRRILTMRSKGCIRLLIKDWMVRCLNHFRIRSMWRYWSIGRRKIIKGRGFWKRWSRKTRWWLRNRRQVKIKNQKLKRMSRKSGIERWLFLVHVWILYLEKIFVLVLRFFVIKLLAIFVFFYKLNYF